jgi:hypothetical protein
MKAILQRAAVATLLAVSLWGCKQGEGEVCQIDDDCQSGLNCNAGTMRCQRPGSGTPVADAAPPRIDAALPDAAPPDAAPDAAPDASE